MAVHGVQTRAEVARVFGEALVTSLVKDATLLVFDSLAGKVVTLGVNGRARVGLSGYPKISGDAALDQLARRCVLEDARAHGYHFQDHYKRSILRFSKDGAAMWAAVKVRPYTKRYVSQVLRSSSVERIHAAPTLYIVTENPYTLSHLAEEENLYLRDLRDIETWNRLNIHRATSTAC